ncbi:hypothetical protein J1605_017767 [Eschrichtius robustus]|uniref:Uncharacterized protein n=1 Tax=Eschrichtius robustus TaxID=9764 RepID=A0AB34HZ95_ESCRO|nr:hypothetical protein J1605_017767 [Eschrichtius robustus]
MPAEVVLPTWLSSTKFSSLIERISDPKDLKKLLRTRNNILVLYSKSEAAAESHLRLLSTVAQAVKGQGTICWVDCGYVLGTWGLVAGGLGVGSAMLQDRCGLEEGQVWLPLLSFPAPPLFFPLL